jgi:dienelactone hydrolase
MGPPTQRQNVQFPSGGKRCSAWLYLPDGARPAPVIVMAHGVGGTRVMRLDAYAERFCAAGYACLVFDYRHFGDSEGEPRQLLDVARQLEDWRAAVACARACPDVDGRRVVLWGTSFGGGHVLAIAADDPHVAAVISQCPFTDGLASTLALNPLSLLKVTARALRDQITSWLGGAPVMVAAAGQPGSAALMTAPDAVPGYRKLQPPDSRAPNEVAARFALQIVRYYPGRRTPHIACPVLFCVCEPDSVAPSRATLRHARRAPMGEIKLYPEGHFDIYVDGGFERVARDQIDFLHRNVPLHRD